MKGRRFLSRLQIFTCCQSNLNLNCEPLSRATSCEANDGPHGDYYGSAERGNVANIRLRTAEAMILLDDFADLGD